MKKNIDTQTAKLFEAARAAYIDNFSVGVIKSPIAKNVTAAEVGRFLAWRVEDNELYNSVQRIRGNEIEHGNLSPMEKSTLAECHRRRRAISNNMTKCGFQLFIQDDKKVIQLIEGYQCGIMALPRIYAELCRLVGEKPIELAAWPINEATAPAEDAAPAADAAPIEAAPVEAPASPEPTPTAPAAAPTVKKSKELAEYHGAVVEVLGYREDHATLKIKGGSRLIVPAADLKPTTAKKTTLPDWLTVGGSIMLDNDIITFTRIGSTQYEAKGRRYKYQQGAINYLLFHARPIPESVAPYFEKDIAAMPLALPTPAIHNVYYRIEVPYYVESLNSTDKNINDAATLAVKKFDTEIIDILQADGWQLSSIEYCPELIKGEQRLYCHPQNISGDVRAIDIEHMGQLFNAAHSFKLRYIDDYGKPEYKNYEYRFIATADTIEELKNTPYRSIIHNYRFVDVLPEPAAVPSPQLPEPPAVVYVSEPCPPTPSTLTDADVLATAARIKETYEAMKQQAAADAFADAITAYCDSLEESPAPAWEPETIIIKPVYHDAATVAAPRRRRLHIGPRLTRWLHPVRIVAAVFAVLVFSLVLGSSAGAFDTPADDTAADAVAMTPAAALPVAVDADTLQVVELPPVTVTAPCTPAGQKTGLTPSGQKAAAAVADASPTDEPTADTPAGQKTDADGLPDTLQPDSQPHGLTICEGTAWAYTMMNWA